LTLVKDIAAGLDDHGDRLALKSGTIGDPSETGGDEKDQGHHPAHTQADALTVAWGSTRRRLRRPGSLVSNRHAPDAFQLLVAWPGSRSAEPGTSGF